jgi:hypothetical protein
MVSDGVGVGLAGIIQLTSITMGDGETEDDELDWELVSELALEFDDPPDPPPHAASTLAIAVNKIDFIILFIFLISLLYF